LGYRFSRYRFCVFRADVDYFILSILSIASILSIRPFNGQYGLDGHDGQNVHDPALVVVFRRISKMRGRDGGREAWSSSA